MTPQGVFHSCFIHFDFTEEGHDLLSLRIDAEVTKRFCQIPDFSTVPSNVLIRKPPQTAEAHPETLRLFFFFTLIQINSYSSQHA